MHTPCQCGPLELHLLPSHKYWILLMPSWIQEPDCVPSKLMTVNSDNADESTFRFYAMSCSPNCSNAFSTATNITCPFAHIRFTSWRGRMCGCRDWGASRVMNRLLFICSLVHSRDFLHISLAFIDKLSPSTVIGIKFLPSPLVCA